MSLTPESAMHAWFENLWNKGDETTIDTMLHVDGVVHGLPTPDGQPIRGPEAFKPFYRQFRTAFPDFRYTIDDQIAEGDKVVSRLTGQGTMKGAFAGMPATGKHATWSEIHISRFTNGKVVEHWGTVDQAGMLKQLGVTSSPTPTLA